MKYDKKDKTKVIVLAAALLVLWAVIGIRYVVLRRYWEAKTEESRTHTHAATPAAVAGPSRPSLRLAALVTPVPPPERDPFHPVIAPRRRGAAQPSGAPSVDQHASVPSLPPPPRASAASSRDTLRVTGIILGHPNTAVLRIGDDHHVVQEGNLLTDQIRVESVDRTSVTLRDRQGTYILRLGR